MRLNFPHENLLCPSRLDIGSCERGSNYRRYGLLRGLVLGSGRDRPVARNTVFGSKKGDR
ncbi:hypothetical protein [Nostoc linckia]|uniref:hypothetical protein n=1 Tax=Nostoc linckia TaxID=92942 RepID=UPI00117E667A|nr:hypothetical protein [Nostoc linckia]